MNVALRPPPMTREEFLDWADAQGDRYEFDGQRPVAMTGGSPIHSLISQNIYAAIRPRLAGTGCHVLGPEAGIATVGKAVRYPDAMVTCAPIALGDRLVADVVAVFEVISLGSTGIDHIVKVREYLAVPSIRTYVIVEQSAMGITCLERRGDGWAASALVADDVFRFRGPDLDIPVAEFYIDVGIPRAETLSEDKVAG